MRDVSESGRTLLFVSHNLTAVQALCNKTYYFERGQLKMQGDTKQVITNYLSHIATTKLVHTWETPEEAPGNDEVRIRSLQVLPTYQDDLRHIDVRTPLKIRIEFWNNFDQADLNLSVHLNAYTGECIFNVGTQSQTFSKGLVMAELEVPGNFLNDGTYVVSVMLVKDTSTVLYQMPEALSFEVEDYRESNLTWYGKWPGYVRPHLNFQISQSEVLV